MALDTNVYFDEGDGRQGAGGSGHGIPGGGFPLGAYAADTTRLGGLYAPPGTLTPALGSYEGLRRRMLGQIPGYGQGGQAGVQSGSPLGIYGGDMGGSPISPQFYPGGGHPQFPVPKPAPTPGAGSAGPGAPGAALPGTPPVAGSGQAGSGPITGIIGQLLAGQGGPNTYTNLLQMLLGGAQGPAGTIFSPNGPEAQFQRESAQRTADALNQRAALMGHTYGLDRSQNAYGAYQSMLNNQGSVANAVNSALGEGASTYADMLRQLFGGALGYNYQRGLADQQFGMSKYGQNKSGLGGLLGQLGGGALGALLGL